jgi:hypothetical protein
MVSAVYFITHPEVVVDPCGSNDEPPRLNLPID